MNNQIRRTSRLFLVPLVMLAASTPVWGQVIHEDIKLLSSDSVSGDTFGWSLAIDNGVVAVGAPQSDGGNGLRSGSAYVFDAFSGDLIFKLISNDGSPGDEFGVSIAIDNGIIAVGAHRDDDNGGGSGSAYLFDAITGSQIAKLLPDDGSAGDNFGRSISINGGIVAIGAPSDDENGTHSGSAYTFDISTGVQLAKLLPGDGDVLDGFSWSIGIDNGIVAVGAWLAGGTGSGYLFDAITGVQTAKLLPADVWINDYVGISIAIDNGVVVVGSIGDDDNGGSSGSAYLFSASTGDQIGKLLAADGAENDEFGNSVAISNGLIVVGASKDDDNGERSGSAYVFDAVTGMQIHKLLTSDGKEFEQSGWAIGIDDNVVVMGVPSADIIGSNSGSAYVFNVNCDADLTDDDELNFFDVSAFLSAFAANEPVADFTSDGQFNFFDISAFLAAFSAGCP